MSNSISFLGRVGQDPELRKVGDSTVLELSIAENVGFGDKQVTNWYKCSIWGKSGVSLQPHISKGKKLFVSGELSLRKWTNKEGVEKLSPEVRVDRIEFGGDSGERSEAPASSAAEDDDSLPF